MTPVFSQDFPFGNEYRSEKRSRISKWGHQVESQVELVQSPGGDNEISENPCAKPVKSFADKKPIQQSSVLARLHSALGPLAGAMILDFADLITVGPIGLLLGLIVGGAVGWWISSIYCFDRWQRGTWALLAGLYCTIPFTAIFPFATILSAFARYQKA